MPSPEEKQFRKRVYVIAAVIPIIVIGVYVSLQFNPPDASAGDNIQESILPKQIDTVPSGKHYKILHVMSYHSPWKWTDDQISGFKSALRDLDVEYKIIEMDTKRRSDEAWKQEISREINKTIETWKPDLVYTNDDNAQVYVTKHYVNSEIPFVFSAVNADPEEYGFVGSKNVTGVLERMHYVATLRLLKKLVPDARKVAMLSDTGAMWPGMVERMKQQQDKFPDIQVVSYDLIPTYEEFKQKVLDYQDQVDALGFFGVFEFKDKNGNNVLLEDVLRWLQENSRLPDFSFWADRVQKGTLCAVTVSGYAQGYQAGLLARGILVDGKSPAELAMTPTEKGVPVINLATARRLHINPSADVLLTAEVIQDSDLK